jgi:hypothetical protein
MPCREPFRKRLRLCSAIRGAYVFVVAAAALELAGCSGQLIGFESPQRNGANDKPRQSNDDDTPGAPSRLLAKLFGVKVDTPKTEGGAAPSAQDRHIFCPEVRVLEGTEASRAYAGSPPSGANLRYQYSITDTARECALDVGQLALKIGVAGKVLLGPAGSAGSFTVPVRMAILRKKDNEPELSKLYHATVNVDQSETQAEFSIVSELLHVPFIQDHSEQDYIIKVGIDEGQAKAEKPHKGGAKR